MNEKKPSLRKLALLAVLSLFIFLLSHAPARAAGEPDMTISKTHTGTFSPLDTGRTYTITVSNVGESPTAGTVTVVDTLPSGLSATGISGPGWSCTPAILTCTRSDALINGNSYPDITLTVDVLVGATNPQTNQADVSGGGEVDTTNNTALDPTTVNAKPDLIVTDYQFLNADKSEVITKPTEGEIFWIRITVENQGGAGSGNFYPGVFLDNKPNYGPDHDEPPTLNLGDVTDYQGYRITSSGAVNGAGCMYYDPTNSINPLLSAVFAERGNYTRLDILPSLPAGTNTSVDVEIAYPSAQYPDTIYDTDNVRSGLKRGGYNIYLYADPNCSGGDEEINETNNAYGPVFIQLGYTFDDVPPTAFAWAQIESVYAAGITGGCTSNPLNYCPSNAVTRAQMAVFLLRGVHGSGYTPPAATGTVFADVPANSFAAAWIEQLIAEGITSGCSGGNYCPNGLVTRAQMAVFLLRAKYTSAYTPPPATGTAFTDVPLGSFAAAWIEQLVAEGITSGCGNGNYCPNNAVSRAQMAVFLQRTFNLPLP
jgi:uncharacterized repeat protein (TIGR01451 family)